MSEFMKRLSEANDLSEEKKTHWPEEVVKGTTYYVEGTPAGDAFSTFMGWEVTPSGPVMRWQNPGGRKWTAIMYEGEMRTAGEAKFVIRYEQ